MGYDTSLKRVPQRLDQLGTPGFQSPWSGKTNPTRLERFVALQKLCRLDRVLG
jgi:hypothetical protein